jgi:GntR family transcriptional repressor for pyruvate dehydrogenase complex
MNNLRKPVRHDTLTDAVINRIKQIILDGEVKPGDWLPSQAELAEFFGVGLSTVREATRALALMGILKPQAGRGTQVCSDALVSLRMIGLVRQEIAEMDGRAVHEARRLIESGITALAAERANKEDIERIEAALDKMEDCLEDDAAYAEADVEYHYAVARAAKNDVVEEFYHIILEMLSQVLEHIVRIPGLKRRGIDYQRQILESIRAHDPKSARKLATENIVEWDQILAVANSSGPGGTVC